MAIDKEKQELDEKIARYEALIIELQKENDQNFNKINELQTRQNALEKIIEESANAIITGNNKGQIIDANKKALKMTKFSLEEICSKNINEILVNTEPTITFSKKNNHKKPNQITNEQILQRKNGRKIYVSTLTKMLEDNYYEIIIKSVNKRKKAELALEEAQGRYKQLAENMHDVIWTASKDLKIVYISGSISKITGFTPEVYYMKPLSELMTPISFQLLSDTIKKEGNAITTATTITLEIKLLQKQHSNIWVELTAKRMQDQLGDTIGFQGVIRNIDEQKKTLEILNKHTQKYNLAIRSIGSGVWELNADLTRIGVDENLFDLLGYKKNETNTFLNDWINLTYKDDRIYIIDILQDILDGKRKSASYDCRRLHKNGKTLWFSDYVEAIYDSDGNIIELLGTSKNITNEKITEEKKYKYFAGLQILIESTFQFLKFTKLEDIYNYTGKILIQNIPGSLIIFSSVNHESNEIKPIRFFTDREAKLIKKLEELLLLPAEKLCKINPTTLNILSQKFLIEYDGGVGEFIQQILPQEICDKVLSMFSGSKLFLIGLGNNSRLTESISIILKEEVELPNKEFLEAFISLSSIIIEKKKLEEQLIKTNETKDRFFSLISHDLKNPFNTFIGFSGLIIQNINNITKEKILEFSKLIHDAALQSHEMMQNLFDWVRSQKGALKCNPVKIDIEGLIDSNIKLFSSDAIKKEIDLQLKSEPVGDFYADIDMLNTILRNLISNAIKFTNKGGNIKISFKRIEDAVQFSIIDNGIGISIENQEKLFSLKTNKSTIGTNMEKGTGLGLLLCDEFVKMHGGKIWIESEEGKGSAFFFTIPEIK